MDTFAFCVFSILATAFQFYISASKLPIMKDFGEPATLNISAMPPECLTQMPGTVSVADCCSMLPVFEENIYVECGFKNFEEMDVTEHIPKTASDPACAKYFCLLEKNYIAENGTIDYRSISIYLDQYAEKYPSYKSSVKLAKATCNEDFMPKNENICQATALTACLTSTFFAECPGWNKSEDCRNLFNHVDKCNMYLMADLEKEEAKNASSNDYI